MKRKLLYIMSLLCTLTIYAQQWQRTGGLIGGLGYNLKIDPTNNQIIYITDALSGIHKSTNGGATWAPKNNGITSRSGDSNDAIPVFTVTIDQNNPTTILTGTEYDSGIYKSTDSGENWTNINQGLANRAITSLGFSSDGKTLFTGTKGSGVYFYNTTTLAVDNYSNLSILKNAYPNPSSGKITLDLQPNTFQSLEVEIFSITGKRILKKSYKVKNNKVEINLQHLSKGMYIVSYPLLNGLKKSSQILIE